MSEVHAAAQSILDQLERAIFGKRETLELVLTCLLSEGHLLIEDVPGTGKTQLAKGLARIFGGSFRRLQCTPDLLPADITGSNVFNQNSGEFEFHRGPAFTNFLLADELNRATPRAQAALLESMAERQISVEGTTYELRRPFFVVATQNPVEHEGTFDLPEAQLDRFLMRVALGYPDEEAEDSMLVEIDRHDLLEQVEELSSPEELIELQQRTRETHVHPVVRRYIVQVVAATRASKDFALGAGPRASIALFRSCQALAAISGRTFVLPDDAKRLLPVVLPHRLILSTEGRLKRRSLIDALEETLDTVPAPVVGPEGIVQEEPAAAQPVARGDDAQQQSG